MPEREQAIMENALAARGSRRDLLKAIGGVVTGVTAAVVEADPAKAESSEDLIDNLRVGMPHVSSPEGLAGVLAGGTGFVVGTRFGEKMGEADELVLSVGILGGTAGVGVGYGVVKLIKKVFS